MDQIGLKREYHKSYSPKGNWTPTKLLVPVTQLQDKKENVTTTGGPFIDFYCETVSQDFITTVIKSRE